MAQNSSIEWTDHTFNPWWGCSKVSPACDNCYAELWAKRMGHRIWGNTAPRRFFSDKHWQEPLKWNSEAEAGRTRRRVFCASMADVFELRDGLEPWRSKLWSLIEKTPWLDWLLLTKRPENIEKMVPWTAAWPANVWLGTTVENQKFAKKRLPFLLKHPAAVRFLSCEPLVGPLDLTEWVDNSAYNKIDWVIAGGESGPGARAMHPEWAARILRQCTQYGIPFHFKQWGHWVPAELALDREAKLVAFAEESPVEMTRLPKKLAGRLLEGKTWNGLPKLSMGNEKRKSLELRRQRAGLC